MSWCGIEGHDRVVERFRGWLRSGKLPSTFIFVGPRGSGKRSFAKQLARCLHCESHADEELQSCGECSACRQVDAESHPDIVEVALTEGKAVIPLEKIIGEIKHRMREGFCYELSLKPMYGRWRIGILDDADALCNQAARSSQFAAANSLLKMLEEPPPQALIILVAESEQQLLPTIRSRSQVIRFQPLETDVVTRILLEKQLVEDPQRALLLSECSHGSVSRAVEMDRDDFIEFRSRLFQSLADSQAQLAEKIELVSNYVDAGGSKEAVIRRGRTREAIRLALDFYQQLMRHELGIEVQGDSLLRDIVQKRVEQGAPAAEELTNRLDICLAAETDILRNLNVGNIIPAWLAELHSC
ncbi:MAG: AAA family ATPase [Pirellulaceae bacterium]